ncbi:hypothetical protein EF919_38830, partial [Streptomyces sp. WAC02707]|uniref:hypothetical protein n=1 Tax=Streptomyces sp. WAC02707 TaxID=2487417 RepID=UPI000F9E5C8B
MTDSSAGRGTNPHHDAPGTPYLRLVPTVPAVDGSAPVATEAARTRPALYAVPQYVAPLIGTVHPGAGLLSSPSAPDGTDSWAADTDEPESVSAEAMALAVQRMAVGSDLMDTAAAPSWTGRGVRARARAETRWFGDTTTLHHVRVRTSQGMVPDRTVPEDVDGPVVSASATPPEATSVPSYAQVGDGEALERPPVTFSAGYEDFTPPGGGGAYFGGPPPADPAGTRGVPLEQTAEWAALLDMLADRDRIYARFDDPAVLDALAARLYDRILAHVRQELVVERERHGL